MSEARLPPMKIGRVEATTPPAQSSIFRRCRPLGFAPSKKPNIPPIEGIVVDGSEFLAAASSSSGSSSSAAASPHNQQTILPPLVDQATCMLEAPAAEGGVDVPPTMSHQVITLPVEKSAFSSSLSARKGITPASTSFSCVGKQLAGSGTTEDDSSVAHLLHNAMPKHICAAVSGCADQWAASHSGWSTTLYTLTNANLRCADITGMMDILQPYIDRVMDFITAEYSLTPGSLVMQGHDKAVPVEPHLVRYDMTQHRMLQEHTDISRFTFTILLSPTDSFLGGGVTFKTEGAPDLTVLHPQGAALVHVGKRLHLGRKLEAGVRLMLVGFLNVEENGAEERAQARRARLLGLQEGIAMV